VVNGIKCSNHCHHQHSCTNVDVEQPVVEKYSALLSVTALTKNDDVLQGRCVSDNVMCTASSLRNEYVQAECNDQLVQWFC